ncbi:MAG: hypothetical protein JNK82_37625 [Myxococcaceae bacterium]|nr:hypothetical protein [Myxococcaceae bacterium]
MRRGWPMALAVLAVLTGIASAGIAAGYFVIRGRLPRAATVHELDGIIQKALDDDRLNEHPPFEQPALESFPRSLVVLHLTRLGCPTFLQAPPERGVRWASRLVRGLAGWDGDGADGACERTFAVQLAQRIGARSSLEATVLANELHRLLSKELLVAYDLATAPVTPGTIGAPVTSEILFNRPIAGLDLADSAQLVVALPPDGLWKEERNCRSLELIAQRRSQLLEAARQAGLFTLEEVRAASIQPVFCHAR